MYTIMVTGKAKARGGEEEEDTERKRSRKEHGYVLMSPKRWMEKRKVHRARTRDNVVSDSVNRKGELRPDDSGHL